MSGEKNRIFLNPEKGASPFEFDAEVAEVFDDMLDRSIPFYAQQQAMIIDLCKEAMGPGNYDIHLRLLHRDHTYRA